MGVENYSHFCYILLKGINVWLSVQYAESVVSDIYGRCSACANKANRTLTAEELVERVNPGFKKTKSDFEHQEKLLASVWEAREQYKVDNNIDKLIEAYEYAMIEAKPPLKNAQSHTMLSILHILLKIR